MTFPIRKFGEQTDIEREFNQAQQDLTMQGIRNRAMLAQAQAQSGLGRSMMGQNPLINEGRREVVEYVRDKTFKEELRDEVDEWLKDVL